jgi:hypothetical protein
MAPKGAGSSPVVSDNCRRYSRDNPANVTLLARPP